VRGSKGVILGLRIFRQVGLDLIGPRLQCLGEAGDGDPAAKPARLRGEVQKSRLQDKPVGAADVKAGLLHHLERNAPRVPWSASLKGILAIGARW